MTEIATQEEADIGPEGWASIDTEAHIAALEEAIRLRDEQAPKSNRRAILEEAANLVDGDRNNQYGDPIQDFRRTAAFWTEYIYGRMEAALEAEEAFALEPHDVAIMMSLLKISRIAWMPGKRDSWADLAGYTACGWDCVVRQDD